MFGLLSFRSVIRRQCFDDFLRFKTDGNYLTDEPDDVTFVVRTVRIAFNLAASVG